MREGVTLATLLNIIAFIPFGFLTMLNIKNFVKSIKISLLFTTLIEFTQLFTGRLVQLEDIVILDTGTPCIIIIENEFFED